MDEYLEQRHRMVINQIAGRGLRDERLLAAFESVPRHLFVPESWRYAAYDDLPQPISHHQTISQPYIVALMTSLMNLSGTETVLEVGTGSGYQAAILSQLAAEVHTIEFIPELACQAERILKDLGCTNVKVHTGDGSLGWPANAPYAGIVVTAAAPEVPRPLEDQLEDRGRLVLPVGSQRRIQTLMVVTRHGRDFNRRPVTGVAFVPLVGRYGWKGV